MMCLHAPDLAVDADDNHRNYKRSERFPGGYITVLRTLLHWSACMCVYLVDCRQGIALGHLAACCVCAVGISVGWWCWHIYLGYNRLQQQ